MTLRFALAAFTGPTLISGTATLLPPALTMADLIPPTAGICSSSFCSAAWNAGTSVAVKAEMAEFLVAGVPTMGGQDR